MANRAGLGGKRVLEMHGFKSKRLRWSFKDGLPSLS